MGTIRHKHCLMGFLIVNVFIIIGILYYDTFFAVLLQYYVVYVKNANFFNRAKNVSKERSATLSSDQCVLPSFDPFNEDIKSFVQDLPSVVTCKKVQPDLTYVDDNGFLKINRTEMASVNSSRIKCEYAYFDRGSIDTEIIIEKPCPLLVNEHFQMLLVKPFLQVTCFSNKNRIFYRNVHSFPVLNNVTIRTGSNDIFNVLIFALESTSAEMFYRSLPLTLDYLKNKLRATEFGKFLKIGENTLPNLVPLFTGLRARNEEHWTKKMKVEVHKDKHGYFDSIPAIWKEFSRRGFVTSYSEDQSHIGTFQYSGKGFRKKPVDFWYFPFWEMIRKANTPKNSSRFCFRNKPLHLIFLDIIRTSIVYFRKQGVPFLFFGIFSELSHDYTNDLGRMDSDFLQLLTDLAPAFSNDTILFVLGDHGPRFHDFRSTFQGYVEERHPGLFVSFPHWFLDANPNVSRSLATNAYRMVTHFDLHQTLLDVVRNNYGFDNINGSTSDRSQSLLRPIQSTRTCAEAGVPVYYCLCNEYYHLDLKSKRLKSLIIRIAIKYLNNVTAKFRDICSRYQYDRLLYAFMLKQSHEPTSQQIYTLGFETKPKSKFEAFFIVNKNSNQLVQDTLRLTPLDSYGKRSFCISKQPSFELKKFCHCKR